MDNEYLEEGDIYRRGISGGGGYLEEGDIWGGGYLEEDYMERREYL